MQTDLNTTTLEPLCHSPLRDKVSKIDDRDLDEHSDATTLDFPCNSPPYDHKIEQGSETDKKDSDATTLHPQMVRILIYMSWILIMMGHVTQIRHALGSMVCHTLLLGGGGAGLRDKSSCNQLNVNLYMKQNCWIEVINPNLR